MQRAEREPATSKVNEYTEPMSAARLLSRIQDTLASVRASARLAKAADKAADAATHFRKVNSGLDDIAGMLRQTPDLKPQLQAALRRNPKMLDNLADIASSSRKGRAGVNTLLDGATDLSDSLRRRLDNLPASAQRHGSRVPRGFSRATSFCSKNPRACMGLVTKFAGLGFVIYLIDRLSKLGDAEKACIAMCMPDSKGPPVAFKTGPDPDALADGETNVYCDGTEGTGTDWAECEEYCVGECTSLEKKCEVLKLSWACNAVSGGAGLLGGVVGEGLNALGLGGLKDIIKYVILGAIIFVVVIIVIMVLRVVFKAKSVAVPDAAMMYQEPILAPPPAPAPAPALAPR